MSSPNSQQPQSTTTESGPSRGRRRTLPLPQTSTTLPPGVDPARMPAAVPNPSHRHGTPSGKYATDMKSEIPLRLHQTIGPWPWLDLNVSVRREESDHRFYLPQPLHRSIQRRSPTRRLLSRDVHTVGMMTTSSAGAITHNLCIRIGLRFNKGPVG